MTAVLQAASLSKHFQTRRGIFGRDRGVVRAVDGVTFAIEGGKTLGVVGESGCGKTTTAKLVLGLETPTGGSILFEGRDLAGLEATGRRHYRKSVQAVFQDRMPRQPAHAHQRHHRRAADHQREDRPGRRPPTHAGAARPCRPARALGRSLPARILRRPAPAHRHCPRAGPSSPRLVVLDEPVSALDVSIRAQILNLLRDLQARLGLSYLFIAHDLAAVAHMSHEIVVMYLGKIVESGEAPPSPTMRCIPTPRPCSPPPCRAIPMSGARTWCSRARCRGR